MVRRRSLPTRVTRGSSGILKAGSSSFERSTSSPSRSSASATMVRNFSIVKGTPSLPARCWRKKTGRPESIRIASAIASSSGESRTSSRPETKMSIARFIAWVERGGSEKRKSSTGSSARRLSSIPGPEQAVVLGQEGERQARRSCTPRSAARRRGSLISCSVTTTRSIVVRARPPRRCRRSSRAAAARPPSSSRGAER